MRRTILIGLLALAGCGGGGTTIAQNDAAAAEPPETLPAGQWQLAAEVTSFRSVDHGAPSINTPVGTRSTGNACVGGGGAQAPTALFAEPGYDCHTSSYYARGGHISVNLMCRRSGLSGSIGITIDGTYTADGIDYTRLLRTALGVAGGNVEIDSHVTGHRTGACTPAPAGH